MHAQHTFKNIPLSRYSFSFNLPAPINEQVPVYYLHNLVREPFSNAMEGYLAQARALGSQLASCIGKIWHLWLSVDIQSSPIAAKLLQIMYGQERWIYTEVFPLQHTSVPWWFKLFSPVIQGCSMNHRITKLWYMHFNTCRSWPSNTHLHLSYNNPVLLSPLSIYYTFYYDNVENNKLN